MRDIIHFDLDTFFVSVERLEHSALNNKPVLVGGLSDRGVVAACSYEARAFGIYSSMPMRLARQLCPDAIIIKGDSGRYSKYSKLVTEVIAEKVPLFEKASIDEFYVDMTGMDTFFSSYLLATELRQTIIKEVGLPISFGFSENKTVSKIATGEAKPNGQIKIEHGTEKPFLEPLPIGRIPMIGKKTEHLLRQMGVHKIGILQAMPQEMMEQSMGKNGLMIWKKANGIDNSPVIPYSERKSISTERTFDKDTIDVNKLSSIIIAMAENLAFQLRRGDKLTGCITVKIRYSDFNTYTQQKRIPYTSCDHTLINWVKEIFQKLYHRRVLVRLIGIRFSHLVGGGHQIHLFEDTEEVIRLYQSMDKMREKYGQGAVKRAIGMDARTIGGRNPFNGEPPTIMAHRKA